MPSNSPNPKVPTVFALRHDIPKAEKADRLCYLSYQLTVVPRASWNPDYQSLFDELCGRIKPLAAHMDLETAVLTLHNIGQVCKNQKTAFDTLAIENSDTMDEFLNGLVQDIPDLSAKELSIVLLACGRAQVTPSDEFLDAWFTTMEKRIRNNELDSTKLSNSLYACHLLKIKPPKSFLEAWLDSAIPQIRENQFTADHLNNSLYAFGTLGIKPPDDFLEVWFERATPRITNNEFTTEQLNGSLHACAILNIKPPDAFLKAWSNCAKSRIQGNPTDLTKKFSPYAISNSVFSLACLQVAGVEVTEEQQKFFADIYATNLPQTVKEKSQWLLASQALEHLSHIQLPPTATEMVSYPKETSHMKRVFGAALETAASDQSENSQGGVSYSVASQVPMPSLASAADFVVTAKGGAAANGKETNTYVKIYGMLKYTGRITLLHCRMERYN